MSPVDGATPVTSRPDPAAAPPSFDATLGERVSDRVNPILVRELLQALNGRAFLATLMLSLFAIVLVALSSTTDADLSRPSGGRAFVLALQALTPVLIFLLPFRAFLSMRQEVSPGTLEHLLLSRLTPGRIVRGKLFAGCVEFGLFLSVFAPLLALTYLLRGIDIPTIALVLALAFFGAFAATTLAVAMGALSRWPAGRAIPLIVLALGLALTTAALVSGMPQIVWSVRLLPQSGDLVYGLLSVAIPVSLGCVLLSLVACAALAHPYENRSTTFRAFSIGSLLVGIGWVTHFAIKYRSTGFIRIGVAEYVPVFVATCALPLIPFWLFAVTEEEAFSPRTRTTVPRRRALALLAAPFLPGGGRGMLFTLLLVGLALGGAALAPRWFGGMPANEEGWRIAVGAWAYTLLFASLLGVLRRRVLAPGPRGSAIARVGAPFLLLFFTLIPTILDLFLGTRSRSWNVLRVLSPAHTLGEIGRTDGDRAALPSLLTLTAILLVFQVPAIVRGLRETLEASRARRRPAP
jgi:hypothetical protein